MRRVNWTIAIAGCAVWLWLVIAVYGQPDTLAAINDVSARRALPLGLEVDGRFGSRVRPAPELMLEIVRVDNLTTWTDLRVSYPSPNASLAEFDRSAFLKQLRDGIERAVPEVATGYASLDFEGGLTPLASKSRAVYKGKMTDAEYEAIALPLFVDSIRLAREMRPDMAWGFWGYPHQNWSVTDELRLMPLYDEVTSLHPDLYIRDAEDPAAIAAMVDRVGNSVRAIRARHALRGNLPAAAWTWRRYASGATFPNGQSAHFALVPIGEMLLVARRAEAWADVLALWMQASDESWSLPSSQAALVEGGQVHNFVRAYKRGPRAGVKEETKRQ